MPPLDTADSYAVSIRADGQLVAAVQAQGWDGLVLRLLATEGRATPVTLAEATATTAIVWSLDGGVLATTAGATLQIWQLGKGIPTVA